MQNVINEYIDGLKLGRKQSYKNLTGFALAHDKQVLHMSLFARNAENNRQAPGSRMIRFSHRMRRRF
jgi:hypothetical protein